MQALRSQVEDSFSRLWALFPDQAREMARRIAGHLPADDLRGIHKEKRKRDVVQKAPGRAGRPLASDDPAKVIGYLEISKWRHLEGLSFKEIAGNYHLARTKANARSMERKRDEFAELVFRALRSCGVNEQGTNLEIRLKLEEIRIFLRSRCALDFETAPDLCARLAKELFPIGRELPRTLRLWKQRVPYTLEDEARWQEHLAKQRDNRKQSRQPS